MVKTDTKLCSAICVELRKCFQFIDTFYGKHIGTSDSNEDWLPTFLSRNIIGLQITSLLKTTLKNAIKFATALHRESSDIVTSRELERNILLAELLLDHCWQKLNTGHWKDIDLSWRYCYTLGSVVVATLMMAELFTDLISKRNYSEIYFDIEIVLKILRKIDLGLLMGAPIVDSPLCKCASVLNPIARFLSFSSKEERVLNYIDLEQFLNIQQSPKNVIFKVELYKTLLKNPLLEEHLPPITSFYMKYMIPRIPVKITGLITVWPAFIKWNVEYLRNVAGARTVPIEVGARYTDENWSQALMTVDEYLSRYFGSHDSILRTEGKKHGYLAQHQLLDQIPELLEDIIIPDYCALRDFFTRQTVNPCSDIVRPTNGRDHDHKSEAGSLNQELGKKKLKCDFESEFRKDNDELLVNCIHLNSCDVVEKNHGNNYSCSCAVSGEGRDIFVSEDHDTGEENSKTTSSADFEETFQTPRIHAWIGPLGTVSPIHQDPEHNILAQVVGYKYIRLYEEDQTQYLYPHPDPLLSNTSQIDLDLLDDTLRKINCTLASEADSTESCGLNSGTDFEPENYVLSDNQNINLGEQFPLFQNAKFQDLILGPGECLYIPPRCWHYVRSLSVSFSVSFWWM